MYRFSGAAGAAFLAIFLALTGAAGAQSSQLSSPFAPPRPNAARPNSQNLMQGPNYWTPLQRRLNVPGANANPSLRNLPNSAYPPPPVQTFPPPAPPVPAETPDRSD